MKISVGNSRTSRAWKIKDLSWDDFAERCSQTIRTAETIQEYRKLPKGQQDNVKDVGGFVGGELRNGIRKKDTVVNRCLLTLDADYADEDFWEQIEMFFDFQCLIYSTHKHTPEHPRLRLIIPLSRPVTADEYTAIARRIAADIGIEQFDDTTYQPHRLMYWASTSADGEFVFKKRDGNPVDADAELARYKDWHDTSEYPVSSRQKKIVSHALKKQADPLEKPGIVGAFCRAYLVQDAIETFLSDVYKPSMLIGRYDYIPADSIAGVIVYSDKFAYSHHATDPACGQLCNAFDLVRIHKFSYLDKDETDSEKSPSFKAMMDFAQNDENVKAQILSDKEKIVREEFTAVDDDSWRKMLTVNKRGDIENTIQNLALILQNDPMLKGIVFNQLSDCIEIKGEVPWQHPSKYWRDADDAQLLTYLTYRYGKFTRVNYDIALAKVVDDRSFHPIRDFLAELPEWDKVPRVDTLLVDYLGAEDNPYTRAVMRKTLCGAIARVMTPGIKFDTMLVLSGPQGIGKSTIISKLCGEWFNDSLLLSDTKDKTAAEKLQGFWILEIGELAGLKKTEIETLRGFISRQNDVFRASFGRRATPHLRQCIFIGTTNAEHGYLRDTTGNRRFFPVKVSGVSEKKAWELTKPEINQIWAESLVYYKNNEPLILDAETEKYAKNLQREAMETDEREGMVREYLETLLPENWNEMSLYERRNFLNGSDFGEVSVKGVIRRQRVCNMEIWCECFGKAKADLKRLDANAISTMVVIDELSSFKSHQSKRFRALRKVRPKIKRIVGLTGTPAPNGLMDLWAEINILDMGERLGRYITHYRDEYFKPDKRNGAIVYSYKPLPDAEERIYEKISDICISMKAADYLDMPARVDNIVEVCMSDSEMRLYRKLETEMLLPFTDGDIDAVNAASLSNKLLQLANGAVYDENGAVKEIHERKLDALEDLIEAANGKPVLVFYNFRHDIDRISKRFNACEIKTEQDIVDWNNGKIQIAVAHPASCGHGLNLQSGGSTIIWFGLNWSLELYQQANARLYRQGQKDTVIIHHIITNGTVDENVIKALKNKDIGQASLMEAVKAKLKEVRK